MNKISGRRCVCKGWPPVCSAREAWWFSKAKKSKKTDNNLAFEQQRATQNVRARETALDSKGQQLANSRRFSALTNTQLPLRLIWKNVGLNWQKKHGRLAP